MLNAAKLADILTDRYGVSIVGTATDDADGQHARFRPSDIPHTQGFTVGVLVGWKTVEVHFTPASYAKTLLTIMAAADPEKLSLFRSFIRTAIDASAAVTFQLNGKDVDPLKAETWPVSWNSLLLKFSRGPMELDGANTNAIESLALMWSSRMLGCVLSLMPLEPVQHEPSGEAEGGGNQVQVTRYERSRLNRAACIEIHGVQCKVCGFDFEQVYGAVGEGFIEIHHIEMVSSLAPGTVLDPARDLVPVCPNCHAMLHRRTPPYSVDELRSMIHYPISSNS